MVDLKKRGLPNWAGDAGIIAAGVLGGGRNPGSKQAVLQSMKNMGTRLKDSKLMDKLFKSNKKQYNKDGSPKIVPGQPVYKNVRPNWNTKLKQWEFQGKKINPQTWNNGKGVNSTQRVRVGTKPKLDARGNPIPVTARDWSKLKIGTGLALPGAAGIQALMNQFGGGGGGETKGSNDFMSQNAQRRETFDAGIDPRTGKKLPGAMTKMQKLGALMKDPKFWMESMSDDPNDTRLMRIGQLLSHYGKPTEGMRALAGTPQEKWAENEIARRKNAAAGGNNSTFLSKFSSEDQDLAIRQEVEKKLGINDWDPTTGPKGNNEDAVNTTVARVKGLIQEFVATGMPWSEALTLAMTFVTEND